MPKRSRGRAVEHVPPLQLVGELADLAQDRHHQRERGERRPRSDRTVTGGRPTAASTSVSACA